MLSAFKCSFAVAAPGALCAAFEMFALPLRGPHMLFFSISHSSLPIVLLVLLAVPAFAIGHWSQPRCSLAHPLVSRSVSRSERPQCC